MIDREMTPAEIAQIAAATFGDMVKIVVDISREQLAVGGGLHADSEGLLLQAGSSQGDIWGANYFPSRPLGSKLEYTAFINIRPSDGNSDQYIQSEVVRRKVKAVVEQWMGPT